MSESKKITYERVSSVALEMITSGVKVTVRGVLGVTGGKTETVSALLRDFNNKRDLEVSKMADELGSSSVAELLAGEIQVVVDRKTKSLNDLVERQRDQIEEMIELLQEKESDCNQRIEMADAKSNESILEANTRVKEIIKQSEIADSARNLAEQKLSTVIDETETEIQAIKSKTDELVRAAEQKAIVLIDSARSEADALVKAANVQIDKSETETISLREQLKGFSVEQAKHEIEQVQFEQAKTTLNQLQVDMAEQKTKAVKLETEQLGFLKEVARLERDLDVATQNTEKLSIAKTQLLEIQKQLSQAQHELSLTQREKDSLSQALAANSVKNSN